jgi:23S rRNA (adenine-N6)-dimethyltransferase
MARRTRPAKWHTQNFLRDAELARTLVAQAGLGATDLVYEIGAGTGTITAALADSCRAVIANEIDARLCESLRVRFAGRPNVQVRCGDFRSDTLPSEPYKVFANPPFDIISEIIGKVTRTEPQPVDTYLVVQREAAERYRGAPDETLVSLLLKPFFAPSVVHHFERDDFAPKPGVDVVMLRLRKRGPPLVDPERAQAYRDLVVSGFTAWKPTVGAALARRFGSGVARRLLTEISLDPALKPTLLSFDSWLDLYAAFERMPDVLRSRVGGAEARLRRQQAHLRKQHRSRAPRDDVGPSRPDTRSLSPLRILTRGRASMH